MELHGLTERGWYNNYDRAIKRAGQCRYNSKTLSFSTYFLMDNNEEAVEYLILHEIAHALVGCNIGHGPIWKTKVTEIGGLPTRTTGKNAIHRKRPHKYTYTCPNCSKEIKYARKPSVDTTCGACCREYNNNKWSEKYILVVKKISTDTYIQKSA